MPIFATEYTEISCLPGFTVDTDLFSVDLVVALDGDVECLFLFFIKIFEYFQLDFFIGRMLSIIRQDNSKNKYCSKIKRE